MAQKEVPWTVAMTALEGSHKLDFTTHPLIYPTLSVMYMLWER